MALNAAKSAVNPSSRYILVSSSILITLRISEADRLHSQSPTFTSVVKAVPVPMTFMPSVSIVPVLVEFAGTVLRVDMISELLFL